MLIKLGNDCEIKKQIEEVEKLIAESGAKTIDELLDSAILSTMNYEGDLVDFNYKEIEGTVYEVSRKLVIGDSFGLWDTDNCIFKGNFMIVNMNKASLSIIIDELNRISNALHEERIDRVDASVDIDNVIDELYDLLKYLK